MPALGTFTPACWMDLLPSSTIDRWALLTEPGWADMSALFFPDRYVPVPLRMVITAMDPAGLDDKLLQLRALRKTIVSADDGVRHIDECLVLGITAGPPTNAAVIIGGSDPGDSWEQEIVVVILPKSPVPA
jgi:hypothetical protein